MRAGGLRVAGRLLRLSLGVLSVLVARPRPILAQDSTSTGTAQVSYVAGTSVYITAGREQGLNEGDVVELFRGERSAATLKVAFLSSHQASCEVVTASVTPVVGDAVRFLVTPRHSTPSPADSSAATWTASRPVPKQSWSGGGLHGRLGARYLVVRQRDSLGTQFTQPALDLRLDGAGLGGTPIGLTADVRARRTQSTLADGSQVTDGRTRVYQAAIFLNLTGSPFRLSVGRQFSPTLATVSVFDGALVDFNKPTWGIGGFGGTQPDLNLNYSSEVSQFGGYLQIHNRPGSAGQWSVVSGAIGSYTRGKVDREFLYLQAAYTGRHLSSYVAQELDYNPSWKRALGEPTLSPTSSFVNLLCRFGESFSLHAGLDNRRNVRLYRDVVTPDVAFDDSYRQGVWGGAALVLARRARLGFDVRSSQGGPAGRAEAYTASFGLDRLTPLHLGLRTRHTRYLNPTLTGWIHSGTVSTEPANWLRLELTGGLRRETNPAAIPASSQLWWYGLDLDVSLGRAVYLLLSATRERGGLQSDDQAYGGFSYRF